MRQSQLVAEVLSGLDLNPSQEMKKKNQMVTVAFLVPSRQIPAYYID
jgi:hypothetical protein